jgi:hypothetical protein
MKTVATVLDSKNSSLLAKLTVNHQLSTMIMGFVGRIIWECHKKGKPFAGVDIGSIVENNGEFKFRVTYSSIPVLSAGLWKAEDGLLGYTRSRASHMARALESNPRMIRAFEGLIERVDNYCQRKGMDFADFEVEKAFITSDDTFVMKFKTNRWGY